MVSFRAIRSFQASAGLAREGRIAGSRAGPGGGVSGVLPIPIGEQAATAISRRQGIAEQVFRRLHHLRMRQDTPDCRQTVFHVGLVDDVWLSHFECYDGYVAEQEVVGKTPFQFVRIQNRTPTGLPGSLFRLLVRDLVQIPGIAIDQGIGNRPDPIIAKIQD